MKNPPVQQFDINYSPRLSSQNQDWKNILVQQFQPPAGEGNCYYDDEHTIFLSLAPRPIRMTQIQGGKTDIGLYGKGDISITPAKTQLFARWESDDRYLQIRLKSDFIQSVARETLEQDPDRLELIPECRIPNPQMEGIGIMLLTELQQQHSGNRLYLDSLANALAVNLLRHSATSKPQVRIYEGGLPMGQLQQILNYIDAHLDLNITLTDLASLLNMSQFHFSHLFKQSIGVSPYQYLLGQRVERAKRLLKQTDRLIVDIALDCGFNSHSHLSKKFRELTGMTPKAYRTN